ncbi:hypothetical protein CRE_19556 [Caenorhabditis remanei]|uniref:Uncharacterized protein n=1 Tax=Caenorhabditis remanei TaxID=31234 RepID=E3NLF8_CAERE|nr:hypothetical protein CRE_19556 [Caenorhabditis remanei]
MSFFNHWNYPSLGFQKRNEDIVGLPELGIAGISEDYPDEYQYRWRDSPPRWFQPDPCGVIVADDGSAANPVPTLEPTPVKRTSGKRMPRARKPAEKKTVEKKNVAKKVGFHCFIFKECCESTLEINDGKLSMMLCKACIKLNK